MLIRLDGISKAFPGVTANDDVTLEIKKGEVHCLLGENGAGKSTLINILAGVQQPDSGTIEIEGQLKRFKTPLVAIREGIGTVQQHSHLVSELTVLENLLLGDRTSFWLKKSRAKEKLEEVSKLIGAKFSPDTVVKDLSLGSRQQLEIAKALWAGNRLLILDEPTSLLTPTQADSLFETIRRLQNAGTTILFITHKLHEAYKIGDSVTVLRAGKVAKQFTSNEVKAMQEEEFNKTVLEAMFGKAPKANPKPAKEDAEQKPELKETLRAENLGTAADGSQTQLKNIDFQVRAGEIIGVAGIDGNGQQHLAETLAGQRPLATGKIFFNGTDITKTGIKERQATGIRYVTDDRINEGTVNSFSVALNLALKKIGEAPFWGRFGLTNKRAITESAKKQIAQYGIKTPSESTRTGNLSGGNIQKILLARELSDTPAFVIFNKPTYGLDLQTVMLVQKTIRDFVAGGGSALFISTDLDEIVAMSDRILVIVDGKIVSEVKNEGARVQENIGKIMVSSHTTKKGGEDEKN